MTENRLLTTNEASRFLAVSKAFLERDRWDGPTVPFVRIGTRTVRYRLDDLQAYIDKRRHDRQAAKDGT